LDFWAVRRDEAQQTTALGYRTNDQPGQKVPPAHMNFERRLGAQERAVIQAGTKKRAGEAAR
jgi:hypothetical protein